jgi:sugar phosphate isomerase/epimerase
MLKRDDNRPAPEMNRRLFVQSAALSAITPLGLSKIAPAQSRSPREFSLHYILASPMYGAAPLADVLGEVHRVGATAIDIWPRRHADHREQMDQLGHARVKELLAEHCVKLAVLTRYDLGPYRLSDEIRLLKTFGGELVVCGAVPQDGGSLKDKVRRFVESMKPHAELAAKHQVTIGIENHANNLLDSPDAIRYFADLIEFPNFGLAFAPFHLPQDPRLIADIIEHLGDRLVFFQAWQRGDGADAQVNTERQLLQMPGRGPLDFTPILASLRRINYSGWTEIFMHPVPRGIPIRETTAETTAEISASRSYLDKCLQVVANPK